MFVTLNVKKNQCVLDPQYRATSTAAVQRKNQICAMHFTEKEHLLPFSQL